MRRFFRVWLTFLGFMLTMVAGIGLLMLPGWLLERATDTSWLGMGLTLLLFSVVWTWFTISPWSRRAADRLGAFLKSVEAPEAKR